MAMKLLSVVLLLAAQAHAGVVARSACYCFPGDGCWPAESAWASLNSTVGGRLIATVPIGSPCHAPNYDATECSALQSQWKLPQLQ